MFFNNRSISPGIPFQGRQLQRHGKERQWKLGRMEQVSKLDGNDYPGRKKRQGHRELPGNTVLQDIGLWRKGCHQGR